MKKMHVFEILRVLGVLEVRQPTYLRGPKASKVLKEFFFGEAGGGKPAVQGST